MYLFSEIKGYEGGGKLSQMERYVVLSPPPQHEEGVCAYETSDIASNDRVMEGV